MINISELEPGDEVIVPLGGSRFREVKVMNPPRKTSTQWGTYYGTTPCHVRDICENDDLNGKRSLEYETRKRWIQLPMIMLLTGGNDI